MKAAMDFSKVSAMKIDREERCIVKSVKPENIFTFPQGILGFEEIKEYLFLINHKVEPFLFMQALHDSNLSFVCIETFLIKPDYTIEIPKESINVLELKSPSDVLLLSIVTIRKNVEDITANLMSPIVINMMNSKAQQVITENSHYPVQFKIWETLESTLPACKVG